MFKHFAQSCLNGLQFWVWECPVTLSLHSPKRRLINLIVVLGRRNNVGELGLECPGKRNNLSYWSPGYFESSCSISRFGGEGWGGGVDSSHLFLKSIVSAYTNWFGLDSWYHSLASDRPFTIYLVSRQPGWFLHTWGMHSPLHLSACSPHCKGLRFFPYWSRSD